MNRIQALFARKPQGILSLYFCAGHPTLDSTAPIIRTLASGGIDMIEIGIPFSDPMADGPVIQDAATKALRNGMTLKRLFAQLEDIRHDVDIPLILMGYLNPIMQFDAYDLRIIMLITPETTDERIRFIDEHTNGFIYMVSSAATTGAQREFDARKQAYFTHVSDLHLRNPRMIGFGISNHQTLASAQQNAAGAIIGSKFVALLDQYHDPHIALARLREVLSEQP